jgi:pyruvate,water dikinase
MESTILDFSSPFATLQTAGGKGANLVRLARAGFPVPPGFILSTAAYRAFVQANGLETVVRMALTDLSGQEAALLEQASARICAAFSTGEMPAETRATTLAAYAGLGGGPVAVRSSATAEDLPDLSFAGQQDTYLNVLGEAALLKAVVDCWSSLWTARAIGYRQRNGLLQDDVALAVVVQKLVDSETSGVLFTANPLTGHRRETVINAVFGLGEALVQGQVEPDQYVVHSVTGQVLSLTAGAKAVATRSLAGGGVATVAEAAAGRRALTDERARELTALGQRVQAEYGTPQDIEWAYAGGQLWLLQARPITSLFPVPRVSFDPLAVWMSFGAFQGILGPLTPLGQEGIQRVALGVGKKLGVTLTLAEQDIFAVAGERVWVRINDALRNPVGSRVLGGFLGIGEPGTMPAFREIMADPHLGAGRGHLRLETLLRLLRYVGPYLGEIPRTLLRPEQARGRFDARIQAYVQSVHIPGGADRFERLANMAAFLNAQGGLADALPILLPVFLPIMAPSLIMLNLISHLLPRGAGASQPGISMSALDVTRALPGNVTTEMDLALWQAAKAIRNEPAAAEAFGKLDAAALAARYLEGNLPAAAQAEVKGFMERYGMRGLGEIDLGQPRWREEPAPVLQTLQSYLQIPPEAAPDLMFEKNARAAEAAIERMAAAVRRTPAGWIKEKLLRGAARRVRLLLGARESPKFYAITVMGRLRQALLQIGEEFVAAGTIRQREDLFFLHVAELEALARGEQPDWQALVAGRRQAYEREARRRQVPRLLASDGRAFYEGSGARKDTGNTIIGSPVSPGVVEGAVRIVLDPRQAQLVPGEILVCPGTDPAWTPLFLAAGGLITEVGGMMTHGSVIAREYGIPAVVGVPQATLRLRNGQQVRVDGTQGTIEVLGGDDV